MRISLRVKVLLLVAFMLLVETSLILFLSSLESQAHLEASKSQTSRRISESINDITKLIYKAIDVVGSSDVTIENYSSYKTRYLELKKDIFRNYLNLKSLVKDNPEKLTIVVESEESMKIVFKTYDRIHKQIKSGIPFTRKMKHTQWPLVRKSLKAALSDELLTIQREESDIAKHSPEKQLKYRNRLISMLFCGLALNVVIAIGVAVLLVRWITDRLMVVQNNAIRLASNEPLLPVLSGNDEIADLDHVFHDVAYALEEASRKERAVLDNASDMIFSIDENGKFAACNPASKNLLGYSSEELIGSYYVDIIHPDDVSKLLSLMESIRDTDSMQSSFEARFINSVAKAVEAEWSVQWSEKERSLFCVCHDISERKELEKMKQEWLYMLTHDIKTPLTSIRSFHEILEAGMLGDLSKECEQYRSMADRNTNRIMNLVNDMLDIEKINSGMMEVEKATTTVNDLFDQVIQSLSTWAKETEVELVDVKSDIEIFVDEGQILRVLTNLVSNAVKFSSEQSSVILGVERVDEAVEISVLDHGRGIPEGSIENIFDSFQQVESSDSRVKGGTGLGLAICKAIVELHGGSIWVSSSKEDGTKFTFSIPVERKV